MITNCPLCNDSDWIVRIKRMDYELGIIDTKVICDNCCLELPIVQIPLTERRKYQNPQLLIDILNKRFDGSISDNGGYNDNNNK